MNVIDFTKFNLGNIGPTRSAEEEETQSSYHLYETDPEEKKENMDILERCSRDWIALSEFRKRRKRNRRYARGDQWYELVQDPDSKDGKMISEEDLIKKRGKLPLKQNVIRPVVKNILGQFRLNKTRPMVLSRKREDAKVAEMLTNALLAAQKINDTRELDARNLEEFVISGMAISKQSYKYWKERNLEDLYTENVNPNRFFFNQGISDVRGMDISRLGELIDCTIDDLVSEFAKTPEDEKRIRSYYKGVDKDAIASAYGLDSKLIDSLDFFTPSQPHLCRVIEVWDLKSEWRLHCHDYLHGEYYTTTEPMDAIEAENQQRIIQGTEQGVPMENIPLIKAEPILDQFWYVKYLSPTGDCLYETETPYSHGEHPYSILLYPLLDGEVWGMIEDIIDQQRYINRIVSMIDWIIGNSAKGVLIAPYDSIPDEEDPTEWAEKWTRADSVILYKPKVGVEAPHQVSSNSVNFGAKELLSVQMNLMKEISGVHGAIQGQDPKSGTPASLYAQEAQNAAINSMDLMESYSWYREKRDAKGLKIITQFYDDRHIAISGDDYAQESNYYTATRARNIEWDLAITQSMDSPVFRATMDDMLYRLLEMQGIDLELFLENTSMPFADKMLESIKAKKQVAEEGGMNPEMQQAMQGDPELQQELAKASQEANEGADPKVMELMKQAFSRGRKRAQNQEMPVVAA